MQLIISIFGIVGLNMLFQHLGNKIKIPAMVISIALGLMINVSFLHDFVLYNGGTEAISTLGDLGLIALMFVAGLGSSIKKMKKERLPAWAISIFGLMTALVVGTMVVHWMGYSWQAALLTGVALSITAEATTAKTLFDAKKLNSKVGVAMLEAGIIDDILGLIFFVVIGLFLREVHATDYIFIFASLAAFFLGAFIKNNLGRHYHGVKKLEHGLNILLIPFLFINIGVHFDFSAIGVNLWLVAAIVLVAFVTKILGSVIAKPFTPFSLKQLHLIGRAMNSRGAIGLAIVLVAFEQRILPVELYSALVIMVILTTLAFPFVFQAHLKRDPNIMQ